MTSIFLGLSADDVVEVTEGLSYGMEIVVVGQESLRDGAFVRISGDSIPRDESLSEEAQGNSQSGRGRGDSNFSLSNLPPERREALIERVLNSCKGIKPDSYFLTFSYWIFIAFSIDDLPATRISGFKLVSFLIESRVVKSSGSSIAIAR